MRSPTSLKEYISVLFFKNDFKYSEALFSLPVTELVSANSFNDSISCIFSSSKEYVSKAGIVRSYESNIGLINFETKCYICNILLYPVIVHSFEPNHVPIKFGLKAYHTRNKVREIIHKLCKRNCWKGLEEQTDQTIIDYLIKKESCRKYY